MSINECFKCTNQTYKKSLMAKWLEQASQGHEMYILSWSGGHEFEPWSGQIWGA